MLELNKTGKDPFPHGVTVLVGAERANTNNEHNKWDVNNKHNKRDVYIILEGDKCYGKGKTAEVGVVRITILGNL